LVLSLDPSNPTAEQGIVRLRDAFLRNGDKALARADYPAAQLNYKKVLLVDPDDVRAHIELARLSGDKSVVIYASQHKQTTIAQSSNSVTSLRGKMETFLASAEGDVRSFLKNARFKGTRRDDISRPDR
jgi:hypothetical protein